MKTNNFNIDLMTPGQINKDVIFNEAIVTIDMLINCSIDGFIESTNDCTLQDKKYIITGSENKDHICFIKTGGQKCIIQPKEGMLMFCLQQNGFLLYKNSSWETLASINNQSSNIV